MSEFEKACKVLFDFEGGYVNDPADSGGETKYGISARSYPFLNIAEITEDQAKQIYKRDYYDKYRIAEIKDQTVALKIFLAYCNMPRFSVGYAVQKALLKLGFPLKFDSIIGSKTISCINDSRASLLDDLISYELIQHYFWRAMIKKDQTKYLKGWIRRVILC